MEQLLQQDLKAPLEPKSLIAFSRGMSTAVCGRGAIEKLRAFHDRQIRRAARAAENAAKTKGATPQDVARRMREILGV